jgi:ATP-binding protein involved in chromosome partitioning
MSEVTTDLVQAALRQVEEPALGRDLVTGGQVRRIEVHDDRIALTIDLISPGYPMKAGLDGAVRAALEPFARRVEIEWGLNVPRKPARQDLDRLPTVKNVIAVAAGKGGVGKSTVSTNLALALQSMGAAVGILDADIYGPSVPQMLGKPIRPADKSTSGDRIKPAIHHGLPVMSVDFFVESGRALIWRGPMIHKLLQQFLEDVDWGNLDFLIVDLPPGTGDAQLSLGQLIPINGGLIVTTPQEVALLDVRKAVDMFKKLEIPVVGVVENMSHYNCPACGHTDHIFSAGGGKRIADEFSVPLLGQLPIDNRISQGGDSGQPIILGAPESELAASFRDLAAHTALALAKLSGSGPKRSSRLRTV